MMKRIGKKRDFESFIEGNEAIEKREEIGSAKREAQPVGAGLRGDQRSERSWRKKRLSLLPEERWRWLALRSRSRPESRW